MDWIEFKALLEWNEVAARNPVPKLHWAQWNAMTLDNGVLKQTPENDNERYVYDLKRSTQRRPFSNKFDVNESCEIKSFIETNYNIFPWVIS